MCSGRVDLAFVLRAFSIGVDGVFIGACHLDECNYMTHGNYQTLNMVLLCRRIMEHIGLNPERLKIAFMSSSEANIFAESVNEFVTKVRELGPLGQQEAMGKEELKSKLAEVTKLVPYIKMVKNEKLGTSHQDLDEQEKLFTIEEIDEMFRDVVSYYIDPANCQACMICYKKCPVEAIEGGKNRIHVVDQDKCIKCGTCFEACPPRFGAVKELCGAPVPPAIPEEERTIVRKGKEK